MSPGTETANRRSLAAATHRRRWVRPRKEAIMKVKEVMTPKVECITPQNTLQEAAQKMVAMDVGSLPVCDHNRLKGMVTDRDITVRGTAAGRNPTTSKVQELLTPAVVYCFEDQDVQDAAEIMKEKQIRRLMVLNRNKKLVGIVSLGDLAFRGEEKELAEETLECVSAHDR